MYNEKKMKKLALGLILAATTCGATAQQQPAEIATYQSSWGFNGEFLNLDQDMAAANGIADSGFGLGASYRGEKGLFNFNAGVSFFFIDDKAEFSQRVESDWTGDESNEKSSIDAGSIYLDGGIQYPLSDTGSFTVGLNAGYRYFDIDRSITNCRNCYSENVSVKSTSYLKPFARFAITDNALGTLAYYSYNGDKGADNSLQFALNWRF